jgi:putative heme transporter
VTNESDAGADSTAHRLGGIAAMTGQPVESALTGTESPSRLGALRRHVTHGRFWPVLRLLLGVGVALLVFWALASHRDELSGLSQVFETLNWWWVPAAVVAEVLSFVCFAGLQYELLRSGGLDAPTGPLLRMTVASQALTNSLPGGSAAATVYGFRWYRRFGADDTLAAWSMVGTLVASIISLSLVATAGLVLATEAGASFDLIPVIIGALLVTVAAGALFVYERPLAIVAKWAIRASRRVTGRPHGDVATHIETIIGWVTTVRLGWRQIARVVLWGAANWLFDCACFAMMFLAVHSGIPWKGLLLAYGAGQLAATLPITPGGLGAVEGSITIALVAFGGARVTTVDAVLMYRIISFWLVLVIGWALWGELALEVRRGRWSRRALTAPVEAGVSGGGSVSSAPRLETSSPVGT